MEQQKIIPLQDYCFSSLVYGLGQCQKLWNTLNAADYKSSWMCLAFVLQPPHRIYQPKEVGSSIGSLKPSGATKHQNKIKPLFIPWNNSSSNRSMSHTEFLLSLDQNKVVSDHLLSAAFPRKPKEISPTKLIFFFFSLAIFQLSLMTNIREALEVSISF